MMRHPEIADVVVVTDDSIPGIPSGSGTSDTDDLLRSLEIMSAEESDALLSEVEKLAAGNHSVMDVRGVLFVKAMVRLNATTKTALLSFCDVGS